MEALRDLADDFNVRDPRKLYRLARQRDLDVTQAMAFEVLKADVGRQVQAPRPRALGKSAAEGPNDRLQADLIDFSQNTQKKLVRSLQGGEHRLTKLGKGFFRDKYYEYLVHVPVIIRGRRRSGRNAGAGYERRDWLPVNELGGATRHPAHLTEEQVAQRVKQQVEASLDPGGRHWVVSTQSTQYRNSRTEVETLLRQRMGPEERELPAALRGGRAAECL